MTIIAGMFNRESDFLDPYLCNALTAGLSRNPDDKAEVFRYGRAFLCKVDVGAYGSLGFQRDDDKGISLLAGDPLLGPSHRSLDRSRLSDLKEIHKCWINGSYAVERARGAFCVALYDSSAERLCLMTDKLGLRPMYYYATEKFLIFSSALRVLEALPEIELTVDLRAATEEMLLGYPLADRSPYLEVKVLRDGETVEITPHHMKRWRYWNWEQREILRLPRQELFGAIQETFDGAMNFRLENDSSIVATLSGGLDSRTVVASSRARRLETYTLNFSELLSQDQIFSAAYAAAADTKHRQICVDEFGSVPVEVLLGEYWADSDNAAFERVNRPRIIWSGNGGSVCLGHVYLSSQVANLMQEGREDAAVQCFIDERHARLSGGVLDPAFAETLKPLIAEGVHGELAEIEARDPARRFHIFLMRNDQRRHLAGPLEDVDLFRLEFHHPFYDSEFVSLILSMPVAPFLGHGLYMDWLREFLPEALAVPWQAYPGHRACPLLIPEGSQNQWLGLALQHRRQRRKNVVRSALGLLASRTFPHGIVSRPRLCAALVMAMPGMWDTYGSLETAVAFEKLWRRSQGRWVLPTRSANARISK